MAYRDCIGTSKGARGRRRKGRRVRRRRGAAQVLRLVGALGFCVVFALGMGPLRRLVCAEAAGPVLPVVPIVSAEDVGLIRVDGALLEGEAPVEADYDAGGGYDFSAPVPESDPAADSYFDDAVFIGDSRTEGLFLNTGLYHTGAVSYAYKGMMVDMVFTKPCIKRDGQKLSVAEALQSTEFAKVYIMLGLNETGWVYSQVFQEKYGELIDSIREINPKAVIYIQGIMPVSEEVSATHDYITNSRIDAFNGLLRELAEEKQVYYMDTGSAVASEDGSLPEGAAADGVHLNKDYCEKWFDYLKTHTAAR